MTTALERFLPETAAGGFTRYDGTVQFFGRVQALLPETGVVVDLGAGRGLGASDPSIFRRRLTDLRGPARRVVGIDVDDAVLENPRVDEALVYDGDVLPFQTGSIDFIVSDHVLEHIDDPARFVAEIERVLRPGGWFCARTPALLSLMVGISSLIPNRHHADVLATVQPGRKAIDVFPTRYRLNTIGAIRRHFKPAAFAHFSYTWSPEPGYHFNKRAVMAVLSVYQYLKQPILGGEVLMVFVQKH